MVTNPRPPLHTNNFLLLHYKNTHLIKELGRNGEKEPNEKDYGMVGESFLESEITHDVRCSSIKSGIN